MQQLPTSPILVKCLRADNAPPLLVELAPLPLPTTAVLRAAFLSQAELDPRVTTVRLIHAGALLNDDHARLSPSILAGGATVHCAVSNAKMQPSPAPRTQEPSHSPAPRDPTNQPQVLVPAGPDGIQVLRQAGFDIDEINAMRMLEVHGVSMLAVPVGHVEHTEDDDLLFASHSMVLETGHTDRHLADTTDVSDLLNPEEGTMSDFCWGAVVGLLLGLIAVVLSMDRSTLLSRRFYTGVLAGTSFNLWLSLTMLMSQNDHVSK